MDSMDSLTPAQRFIVTLVGLAITFFLLILILPWLSQQLEARLIPTSTPPPATRHLPTPTLTAAPSVSPTLELTPPPVTVLDTVPYISQTVQYDGPAALAMVLGYWGYSDTDELVAAAVQPGESDVSVELEELAAYAESRQLFTYVGVDGDEGQLRRLIGNGFPVLLSRWVTTTEGTGAIHYPVLYGYDSTALTFTLHDPISGTGVVQSYQELAPGWRAVNHRYLLIWPEKEAERAKTLLAQDNQKVWQDVLAQADRELSQNAQDAVAHLNRASALAALGRCSEALLAFVRTQELGLPGELWWHRFEIYNCYLEQNVQQPLLTLLQTAVDGGAPLEQIPLYQARAYKALGSTEQAQAAYERALAIHPDWEVVLQEQNTP